MSKRKPKAKERPTTILRRSPRFLSTNSPETLNPNTPKLNHEPPIRSLRSSVTPLSHTSKSKSSNGDSGKLVRDEVSRNTKAGVCLSNNQVELRRSMRLSEIENRRDGVGNGVESEGDRVLRRGGKRVDACSVGSSKSREGRRIRKRGLGIKDGSFSDNSKRNVSSASATAKLGVDLCKEVEGAIEKRVTRSDSHRNELKHGKTNCNAMLQGDRNRDLSKSLDEEEFANAKTRGVKLVAETISSEENVNNVCGGKEQIGKKRNLNQCKGKSKSDCAKGWNEEQERALQKAYFAANPTPQFWKRVSKMVPGKSAQDCFDKIHSAHLTPPVAQPRSRAKKITPSSLSFSASKLLNSPEPKSKKPRCSHLAQKMVRHLIQKQCNNDQDKGADFFAIFEATADPSNGSSQPPTSCCTPEINKGGSNFHTKCNDTSSADRKSLSRLNMSSGSCFTSPPVLKQIKNKALHEQYIDQLHRRETRRKAALSKAAKQVASQNNKLGIQDGKIDALKAAKNALYFEASDAISQLQQSQMNAVYKCDFSDDDHLESSDDGED